jgi:hypothetical protein
MALGGPRRYRTQAHPMVRCDALGLRVRHCLRGARTCSWHNAVRVPGALDHGCHHGCALYSWHKRAIWHCRELASDNANRAQPWGRRRADPDTLLTLLVKPTITLVRAILCSQ